MMNPNTVGGDYEERSRLVAEARASRFLFLVVDSGGGHRSPAEAIMAALDQIAHEPHNPGAQYQASAVTHMAINEVWPLHTASHLEEEYQDMSPSEVVDVYQECSPHLLYYGSRLYGPLVTIAPSAYALFFHLTNTPLTSEVVTRAIKRAVHRRLAALFRRFCPDVIVTLFPQITRAVTDTVAELGLNIPVVNVITDLASFRRSWAVQQVDTCLVQTTEAYDYLLKLGMPKEKLRRIGFVVHPRCLAQHPSSPETLHRLGLRPDVRTILVAGGAEGIGPIEQIAHALGTGHWPIQLIVVTGRNTRLFRRLLDAQKSFRVPSRVLGFVRNFPELLRASDLFVTKGGSSAITESIACKIPIVLFGVIPGQEAGHIDFLESRGVGVWAPTSQAVLTAVNEFFESHSRLLLAVKERYHTLQDPLGAYQAARIVLDYANTSSVRP